MSQWFDYVTRVAGTDNQSRIGDYVGIPQSTISKWKSGQKPSVAHCAKFALKYERNVLEAFVAAELLTPEEAELELPMAPPTLFTVPTTELVDELSRRVHGEAEASLDDYRREKAGLPPASRAAFLVSFGGDILLTIDEALERGLLSEEEAERLRTRELADRATWDEALAAKDQPKVSVADESVPAAANDAREGELLSGEGIDE